MRVLVALLVALLAPAAARAGETIQPGMFVQSATTGSSCTGNFIYDGIGSLAGKTYIGLASHCVGGVSDPLMVDRENVPFGLVVHKNWPLESIREDWALIEILPERLGDVDPAQRGNPQFPTGVADEDDVKVGDEIRISGWGAFMQVNHDLQTRRTAVTTFWDGDYYDLAGPIVFGDSGGALVHLPTGKALGIVSAYCTPNNWTLEHVAPGCVAFGPSVAAAMREMEKAGFPVRIRLAGEPPPAPPAPPQQPAPAAQPPAQPASKPAAKRKPKPRCKTRKQRRGKRCRRARARRR